MLPIADTVFFSHQTCKPLMQYAHQYSLHTLLPQKRTHLSPNEYTNGWLPSSGHISFLLNSLVSHMTSYMT